jgi:hypothetical protein
MSKSSTIAQGFFKKAASFVESPKVLSARSKPLPSTSAACPPPTTPPVPPTHPALVVPEASKCEDPPRQNPSSPEVSEGAGGGEGGGWAGSVEAAADRAGECKVRVGERGGVEGVVGAALGESKRTQDSVGGSVSEEMQEHSGSDCSPSQSEFEGRVLSPHAAEQAEGEAITRQEVAGSGDAASDNTVLGEVMSGGAVVGEEEGSGARLEEGKSRLLGAAVGGGVETEEGKGGNGKAKVSRMSALMAFGKSAAAAAVSGG